MSQALRILILHSKMGVEEDSSTDELLATLKDSVVHALSLLPNVAIESVTLSGEDWAMHFATSGGWEPWCARWAVGRGADGRYYYDVFVLIEREGIRKGNGRGVEMALRAGRDVYWFAADGIADGDRFLGHFLQVRNIVQTGGNAAWPVYAVGFAA